LHTSNRIYVHIPYRFLDDAFCFTAAEPGTLRRNQKMLSSPPFGQDLIHPLAGLRGRFQGDQRNFPGHVASLLYRIDESA
jgi:hypothetical protein